MASDDIELLRQAGFSDEEILSQAGFDIPTIQSGSVELGNRVFLNPQDSITKDEAENRLRYEYAKEGSALKEEWDNAVEQQKQNALKTGISIAAPMALGAVGGAVARAASPFGNMGTGLLEFLGSSTGEAVGKVATDERGLGALKDYTSANPLTNPLILNGLATTGSAVSGLYRKAKPPASDMAVSAAQKEGSIVSQLGLLDTPSGSAKATDLIAKEKALLDTGVIDDAVRTSKDPYLTLSENISNKNKQYNIDKWTLVKESDKEIGNASNLNDIEAFTKQRVDALREEGIPAKYNEEAIKEARNWMNRKSFFAANSQQLDDAIGSINNRLRELGTVDRSVVLASGKGNVSSSVLDAEEQGLKYLRDYFTSKLDARTNGVYSPLQSKIGVLRTFDQPVKDASVYFRKELAPKKAVQAIDRPTTSIPEAVGNIFGGGNIGREARRSNQAVGADVQAVKKAGDIIDYKNGKYPIASKILNFTGSPTAMIAAKDAAMLPFQSDPYANGLPRDTERFGQDALVRLAANVEKTVGVDPQAENKLTMLKFVGIEYAKALRSQDEGKQEKLVSDLAKLFPEQFEPGRGVNNKLFHPDDQQAYMDELRRLMRSGKVGSSFLAKQRDIFLDKNDGRILDLEPPVIDKIFSKTKAGTSPAGTFPSPRNYSY